MPTARQPQFDLAAATAALGYIATKIENVDLHKAFKLLYLAEKSYLEQYGRPFAGDQYIAMDWGPVPSVTYDLAKAVRGDPPSYRVTPAMLATFSRFIGVRGLFVTANEPPDLGELSRGAVRCLDEAISKYGDWTFGRLTKEAHDGAWQASRLRRIPGQISLIDIARSLPQSEPLVAHLSEDC